MSEAAGDGDGSVAFGQADPLHVQRLVRSDADFRDACKDDLRLVCSGFQSGPRGRLKTKTPEEGKVPPTDYTTQTIKYGKEPKLRLSGFHVTSELGLKEIHISLYLTIIVWNGAWKNAEGNRYQGNRK